MSRSNRAAPARRAAAPAPAIARKPVLHQDVYRALRGGLMAGAYAPGQTVSLRSLAATFGTSPMPVRAAVNRLIAERALQLLPNRSIIVPLLTRASFEEVTRIRIVLEGMAAESAAAQVSPRLLAELSRINADLQTAIADVDVTAALHANQQFHFRLYEASGSAVLQPLIEALWLQVGPFMHVSMTAPESRWNASQHHAALAGLQRADAASVRHAIETDIADSAAALLARGVFAP